MSDKLFLFEDVSSKWLELAKDAKADQEIFIFSPYITGNLIPEIAKSAPSNPLFIITCLSADAYLGGALDTDVLTSLMEKGTKIFHLPRLHAKLMLIGSNLSVGSQNFTDGGKNNIEASHISKLSKGQTEDIEEKITGLLKLANAVDADTIEKFINACEQAREQYDKTHKTLDAIDTKLEEFFVSEEQQHEAGLQQIELIKSKFNEHFLPVPVVVRDVEYNTDYGYENYYTLKSTDSDEILNIFIPVGLPPSEDKMENYQVLKSQKRYICFELNSLRLFWINANKRQIGKFATNCRFTNWKSPDGTGPVTVSLKDPHEEKDFVNIRVKFDTKKYGEVHIGVLFTGSSFLLKHYSNKPKETPAMVIDNWDPLRPVLIDPILAKLPSQILNPFSFQSKNTGISPLRLFRTNQYMKLGLQKYEDKLFYILQ